MKDKTPYVNDSDVQSLIKKHPVVNPCEEKHKTPGVGEGPRIKLLNKENQRKFLQIFNIDSEVDEEFSPKSGKTPASPKSPASPDKAAPHDAECQQVTHFALNKQKT